MLIDQHNRIANYLRIGVTDRCNLRCRYCMPAEGIDFAHRNDLLSYEEIIRLSHIFSALGVDKVRLTGGEPFVRKGIDSLLKSLADIFPKVHITTNATLLEDQIDLLKSIKLAGLNISIDSLDRERFFGITRRDDFEIVMKNIHACLQAGIPTKLNAVAMKGVNDMELIDFVRFGIEHQVEVRFIEAMPFNEADGNKDVFISAMEMEARIKAVFPQMHKVHKGYASSSDLYMIDDNKVGIIPAYSRSLCGSCNRVRLTPKGEFLTCLYAKSGLNLLELIRDASKSDEDIKDSILRSITGKLKSGFEEEARRSETVFNSMTTIGG